MRARRQLLPNRRRVVPPEQAAILFEPDVRLTPRTDQSQRIPRAVSSFSNCASEVNCTASMPNRRAAAT